MTLGESRRHFETLRGFKRLAGIEDLQNEIGTLQLALGSLNADALDGILRIAKAGSIHEAQRNAMHLDDFLDRIPRGARCGTHDRTLKAEQEIEQTAFAHIRCFGASRAGTVTQDATLLGGGEELAGMRLNGVDTAKKIRAGFGRDVLVRKVDIGLDVSHGHEHLLHLGCFATDRPAELLIRSTQSQRALGVNEIHHGLRPA